MKTKELLKTTTNSNVYNRAYRHYLEYAHGICSRCPPRKGCNWGRRNRDRNWKNFRKTQYKPL